MSMSIGGIGSGGNSGGFDLSKMASSIASKMMKDLDTNNDGSLDKKEFVAGLTAKGISSDEAGKQFDAIDTKKTGKIDQVDIESAIKSGKVGPSSGARPPGGGAPAGAGRSAGGDSGKTYDPADTNKDGTVSAEEALIYSMSHQTKISLDKPSSAHLGNNVDQTV